MERIKRRLRALEGGKGKIARTQAHLNGRYTLRWRTCTCVLRLHSFARSLGSSVYLAAKQHTQARAHTYTHWPTCYVLAPSEIVSGYSRQTLGLSPFLFDGQPFLARSTSFWILNWYLVSQSFSTRTITSRYLRFLVELVVTCDANLLVTIYLVS